MIKYYFIDVKDIKKEYLDEYSKLEKYASYKSDSKRYEKIARDMLFDYMMKCENINSEVAVNEYGKPYFKNSKYHFSISHSDGKVIIALSNKEVGIDIQKLSNYDEERIERLARRIYNDNDYDYFNNDDNTTFTQIWTIKEAYLKYIGYGLIKNIHDVIVEYKSNNVYLMDQNPVKFYTCYCGGYIVSIVSNDFISNKDILLKNKRIFYQGKEMK